MVKVGLEILFKTFPFFIVFLWFWIFKWKNHSSLVGAIIYEYLLIAILFYFDSLPIEFYQEMEGNHSKLAGVFQGLLHLLLMFIAKISLSVSLYKNKEFKLLIIDSTLFVLLILFVYLYNS